MFTADNEATLNKHSNMDYIQQVNTVSCPIERLNILYSTADSMVSSMTRTIIMNSLSVICAK